MSHAMQSHPRWTDYSGEFWQNVVHWKREWQTTTVFLPQEPHEQYERQNDMTPDELPKPVASENLLHKAGSSAQCSVMTWRGEMDVGGRSKTEGVCVPGGSDSKESACSAGDLGSILRLGRSSGEGHGYLLQYSRLENPHGQRSLAGYSPWGLQRVRHNWATFTLSGWFTLLYSRN